MYHIKNDRRVKKSADALSDTLMECLKMSELSDIPVSELCQKSAVSRATFYRIFDTSFDILRYISDRFVQDSVREFANIEPEDKETFFKTLFRYLLSHIDEISALIRCGRQDILQSSIEKYSSKFIPAELDGIGEERLDYLKMSVAGIIVSLLYVWDKRGRKETAEDLYETFCLFSQRLG